jgi:hypothetical protein
MKGFDVRFFSNPAAQKRETPVFRFQGEQFRYFAARFCPQQCEQPAINMPRDNLNQVPWHNGRSTAILLQSGGLLRLGPKEIDRDTAKLQVPAAECTH